jgi:hypothetical protein
MAMLGKVLGDDFKGVIGSDCYPGYISYIKNHEDVTGQLCIAHLIRDFRNCNKHLLEDVSSFGEVGLNFLQSLIHDYNSLKKIEDKGSLQARKLNFELKQTQEDLMKFAANAPSSYAKARGISQKFKDYPNLYFTFLLNPNVSPTNNVAERALRRVVLHRKINQGTQSFMGNLA